MPASSQKPSSLRRSALSTSGDEAAAAPTQDAEEVAPAQEEEEEGGDGVTAMDVDGDEAAAPAEKEGEEEVEAEGEAGDEDGSLGEEEYEIEAILHHGKLPGKVSGLVRQKREEGALICLNVVESEQGGFRYMVSWLGYGPEHNSFVDEADFGSPDLVEAYWKKQPGGRPVPKSAKSAASNTPSSARTSKRRGASPIDLDTPEPSAQPSAAKRAKRDPGAAVKNNAAAAGDDDDYQKIHTDSIEVYMNIKNWEEQVKSIETVERGTNQKLQVYVIMAGGEKCSVDAQVIYTRCPKKMFKFYEDHLKWRTN